MKNLCTRAHAKICPNTNSNLKFFIERRKKRNPQKVAIPQISTLFNCEYSLWSVSVANRQQPCAQTRIPVHIAPGIVYVKCASLDGDIHHMVISFTARCVGLNRESVFCGGLSVGVASSPCQVRPQVLVLRLRRPASRDKRTTLFPLFVFCMWIVRQYSLVGINAHFFSSCQRHSQSWKRFGWLDGSRRQQKNSINN